MTTRSLFVTLLALSSVAGPAAAYKVQRSSMNGQVVRWSTLPVKFDLHSAAAPGASAAETQAAVRAAYKAWSTVSCSKYQTQDLGVVSRPNGDQRDHVNTNAWLPSWPAAYGAAALGVTQTIYDPQSGRIMDADTFYNGTKRWSVTGSPFAYDVQAVATHELGHQLGLDHSTEPTATMYYATAPGDTSQRSLHSDDLAGLCFLYPSGGVAPPECTVAEHCAPNETCQDQKCVAGNKQGYGGACSSPAQCLSGMCLGVQGTSRCSQPCDAQPCPNGDACMGVTGGTVSKACLPSAPAAGSKGLGEACGGGPECKSTLCVAVPGTGNICSESCQVSASTCPKGYQCAPGGTGGLCVPEAKTPVVPSSRRPLGERCAGGENCQSGLCGETGGEKVCTQLCQADEAGSCPSGFVCAGVVGSDRGACIRDPRSGGYAAGTLGGDCQGNQQCNTGICATTSAGARFCTQLCTPEEGCPVGFDCTAAGNSRYACTPAAGLAEPTPPGESSGCDLTASPFSPGAWSVLLAPLLPLLLRLRRRQRPPATP
ncbi:MAG: matrixin family metalloprotease [Deltaproteobacteria bacterium]|nr:matrixin family metalloprotease [Deltaproteobacteria bacterium]